MNDYWIAFFQGVLEGLTEFMPVSSTGHLILLGNALDFTGARADTFNVFIQLGAILAVIALYPHRFLNLLKFKQRSKEGQEKGFNGWNGIGKLFVACLPAFVFGALLHGAIKERLFFPLPVVAALFFGGIVIVWLERRGLEVRTNSLESLSFSQCLGIGFFQCLALWPGMSRSGSTIIGAMIIGVERKTAAEFSFLVAVPVMCAAVAYDLLKSYHLLSVDDIPLFAIGFFVSFITALLAIRFFVTLLGRYSLAPFGWYRIALSLVVLGVVI